MPSKTVEVTAAGGVVYKNDQATQKILLIKRNGVWDIPKGKLEEDETIEECALREVEEETGAKGLFIEEPLCETYHEYERDGLQYGKTTYWYLMNTDQPDFDFQPEVKEGITELRWVKPGEAKKMVQYENLIKVLDSLD